MKTIKCFIALGMVAVLAFFTHILLGDLLHAGYNPIHQSISELTADGAPYFRLLRALVMVYEVCLLLFLTGTTRAAFSKDSGWIKTGFALLFITALLSIVGYNRFPMTLIFIISIKNALHTVITLFLLFFSILAVLLVAIGYLIRGKKKKAGWLTGWFALACAVIPAAISIFLWCSALAGGAYFGLLERMTVYPFHIFTFVMSWQWARYIDFT